jgi:hypothetical protein
MFTMRTSLLSPARHSTGAQHPALAVRAQLTTHEKFPRCCAPATHAVPHRPTLGAKPDTHRSQLHLNTEFQSHAAFFLPQSASRTASSSRFLVDIAT